MPAGQVASAVRSPDFGTDVAIGMVAADGWAPGTNLTLATPEGPREAEVRAVFWL